METCKTLQEIKIEMKKPQHPLEVSLNYKETLKFLRGEKYAVITNRQPNAITREQKLQCGQNRKREPKDKFFWLSLHGLRRLERYFFNSNAGLSNAFALAVVVLRL